jgi:tetratricopeptide (TPR) repeat protein
LQSCQKAISLADDLANGHTCLGMVDNSTGHYEEAVQQMQRALQLDPTSDDTLRGLASAYESLGRAKDAEQTYLRAIELRPQYWGGYAWLGGFYWRHARYDDAARMYTEMIALAPDSFQGYNNLGVMYLLQGRYKDAIPQFQRSAAIASSLDAYSNLATAFFLQGNFADAAHTYERAADIGQNDALAYIAWGNLAEAYYWMPGQRERATAAYQKAASLAGDRLKVNSRDGFAIYHLALYQAMLGQQDPALNHLEEASRLLHGDSELLFNAAKIYMQLRRPEAALAYLQKSLAAGYSVPFVRDDPMFRNLASNVQFQRLVSNQ